MGRLFLLLVISDLLFIWFDFRVVGMFIGTLNLKRSFIF